VERASCPPHAESKMIESNIKMIGTVLFFDVIVLFKHFVFGFKFWN